MSKNFLKVLDSLPKDQQQTFIDHFVRTLNGESVEPLIMPESFTIANEGSIEDRILHMASIYDVDPESVDREELRLLENEVTDSKILIRKLIENHLNKDKGGQRSKNDELLDLGKFLYTSNYNLEIQQSEKPDFILTEENKTIGLEHTRLVVSKDKQFFNALWKEYIQDALKIILTEQPDLTGIVNLVLDVDSTIKDGKSLRDFKESAIRKNLTFIHKSIAEYIIAFISGNAIVKPAFIKNFNYQPSKERFTIKQSQEFFRRNDFEEILSDCILKKESRLNEYKKERNNYNEWWLLIVYDGVNYSSSFVIDEKNLENPIVTSFDRVFILNSFDLSCYEIKNIKPYLTYIATKEYRALHTQNYKLNFCLAYKSINIS